MELRIPELSLVLMVGASGSGESTFACRHFLPTETLPSDVFRALVSDDAGDQGATTDAFDALHHLAGIRLRRGRFTVVDATNTQCSSRAGLIALAARRAGWTLVRDERGTAVSATHPVGRTAVFLGDLVDRGPDTPGVLRLAMGMVASRVALAIAGNHEVKLVRALRGRDVKRGHGLAESLTQLAALPQEFVSAAVEFMGGLIGHYVLDGGRLVVAHAGLREQFHGRASRRVRAFSLYGETSGETDEYGLPVRYPWALDYRGAATVVYGHTPVPDAEWVNNTICVDTGCVFGALTALRYPERELVSVPAAKVWFEPIRRYARRSRCWTRALAHPTSWPSPPCSARGR